MSQQEKKTAERTQLDRLMEFLEFPLGQEPASDWEEEPDFLYRENSCGVEITTFMLQARMRHIGDEEKVLSLAKSMAVKAKIPAGLVYVSFSSAPIQNHRRRALAEEIFATASRHLVGGDHDSFEQTADAWGEGQPPCEVDAIGTYKHPLHNNEHGWYAIRSSGSPDFNPSVLQACIDKKNGKLDRYLESCNSCWLLIVLPRGPQSPYKPRSVFEKVQKEKFSSRFQRVFLLSDFEGTVLELDVSGGVRSHLREVRSQGNFLPIPRNGFTERTSRCSSRAEHASPADCKRGSLAGDSVSKVRCIVKWS